MNPFLKITTLAKFVREALCPSQKSVYCMCPSAARLHHRGSQSFSDSFLGEGGQVFAGYRKTGGNAREDSYC